MPVCCRCNGSGRCKGCTCKKNGRACTNCLPYRRGQCSNLGSTTQNTESSEARTTIPAGLREPADQMEPENALLIETVNMTQRIESDGAVQSETVIERVSSEATDGTLSTEPVQDFPNAEPTGLQPATSPLSVNPATMPAVQPIRNPPDQPRLPPFQHMNAPSFAWSELMDGQSFSHAITAAYAEVIHWGRNLFHVPSGKAGISFVNTLSTLFRAYGEGSALESIALRAAMVLPILLLQKPHARSRTKEHVTCLQRRLNSWKMGDIDSLVREGRTIQRQLRITSSSGTMRDQQPQHAKKMFVKNMKYGNVKAALRLLDNQNNGGPLSLDTPNHYNGTLVTVREALFDKHPPGQPAHPETLLNPTIPPEEPHPILFEQLDEDLIRSTALRINGSAGPSGVARFLRMEKDVHLFSASFIRLV